MKQQLFYGQDATGKEVFCSVRWFKFEETRHPRVDGDPYTSLPGLKLRKRNK
jgi:hypothetical protein